MDPEFDMIRLRDQESDVLAYLSMLEEIDRAMYSALRVPELEQPRRIYSSTPKLEDNRLYRDFFGK